MQCLPGSAEVQCVCKMQVKSELPGIHRVTIAFYATKYATYINLRNTVNFV